MKKLIYVFGLFFLAYNFTFASGGEGAGISADEALAKLREGNERFIAGKSLHPNLDYQRRLATSKDGQKPFATVLGCSDSRVPVEMIFDQGVGDVFTIKVAGNVADVDEIATIEYGTEHLKTPVLVVLGHTKCGAVTAVATEAELHGNLPGLVDNIKPAYEKAKTEHPNLKGKDIVPATIKSNVFTAIEDIIHRSTIIAKLLKEGKLKIVGAIYDIETGGVDWLGAHPNEAKLITEAKDPHDAHAEAEAKPFFSTPNVIYMTLFLVVCSLITGIVIFVALRKSAAKD